MREGVGIGREGFEMEREENEYRRIKIKKSEDRKRHSDEFYTVFRVRAVQTKTVVRVCGQTKRSNPCVN